VRSAQGVGGWGAEAGHPNGVAARCARGDQSPAIGVRPTEACASAADFFNMRCSGEARERMCPGGEQREASATGTAAHCDHGPRFGMAQRGMSGSHGTAWHERLSSSKSSHRRHDPRQKNRISAQRRPSLCKAPRPIVQRAKKIQRWAIPPQSPLEPYRHADRRSSSSVANGASPTRRARRRQTSPPSINAITQGTVFHHCRHEPCTRMHERSDDVQQKSRISPKNFHRALCQFARDLGRPKT
jgi:hypothetical protein